MFSKCQFRFVLLPLFIISLQICCQLPLLWAAVHKFALKSHHLHSQQAHPKSLPNGSIGGGVPAKFYSDHLLIGNISVGTPGQNFQVAFQLDSASSYLIGPNADLSDQGDEYKKNIFNADNSSTYKRIWGDFESETHDVYGQLSSDIAMLDTQECRFVFGVADYVPYYVERMPVDGEMGLAARFDVQNGVESLWQQLAANLGANEQLLSVRIKPHEDVEHIDDIPYDSALTIGAEDRDNCNANWHYVPLVSAQDSWKVQLAFYAVSAGKRMVLSGAVDGSGKNGPGGSHAEIVELNRHLRMNYGPKRWIWRIALALGGGEFDSEANLFQIGCPYSSTANLIFGLGESGGNAWEWTMAPTDYTINRGQNCYLAFYAINIGQWGFSTNFYANNCVTVDYAKNLIGFSAPLEGH